VTCASTDPGTFHGNADTQIKSGSSRRTLSASGISARDDAYHILAPAPRATSAAASGARRVNARAAFERSARADVAREGRTHTSPTT
jgi:hypothetical protein